MIIKKLLYIAILLFITGIYFDATSEEIAMDNNIEFFAEDDNSDVDAMFSSEEENTDDYSEDDFSIIEIDNTGGAGVNQDGIESAEKDIDTDSSKTTENILATEDNNNDSNIVNQVELPPLPDLGTNLEYIIQSAEDKEAEGKESDTVASDKENTNTALNNESDTDVPEKIMTWTGSFLYTQEEITILKDTIEQYHMMSARDYSAPTTKGVASTVDTIFSKPDEAFINLERIAKLSEADRPAPVFYLDSILYFSENNWSIWLNGKKLSLKDKVVDNLEIIEVKPENIQVSYKVDSNFLRNYFPIWKKILTQESNDSKILASVDNKINYNTESNVMIFNLQPNQSMKIAKLEILEGRHHVGHNIASCGFSSCKVDVGEVKAQKTKRSKERYGIEKVREQDYNPLQSLKNLIK